MNTLAVYSNFWMTVIMTVHPDTRVLTPSPQWSTGNWECVTTLLSVCRDFLSFLYCCFLNYCNKIKLINSSLPLRSINWLLNWIKIRNAKLKKKQNFLWWHYSCMKLNSYSGTNSTWRDTVVFDPSHTECTLILHFFLFCDQTRNSSHDWVSGVSVKMSTSLLLLHMCSTVCVSILAGDVLRMWPSHANRRARIARTKSNDRVSSLTSSWGDLPWVITNWVMS